MGDAVASLYQGRKNSAEPMATKLTQTMSKNLSFGGEFGLDQNLMFGSNQSRKNRAHVHDEVDEVRRNPHLSNLPLQILSETSSDDGDKMIANHAE